MPVHFAVGLQVHFNVSFFEASPYFLNIRGDMAGVHMSPPCWEVEIHWEMGVSPKHQVMWWVTCHLWSSTVIHLEQLWQVLLPLHLFIWTKFAYHSKEHLMKTLDLSIALWVVCSGLAFLDGKHGTQLFHKCRGKVWPPVTKKLCWHTEYCDKPFV